MKAAILVAAILFLSGCATGLPDPNEAIKALANSDRTWCVGASTPWGKGSASGTGATNTTVTCSMDGMTVRAEPPVSIPMGPSH